MRDGRVCCSVGSLGGPASCLVDNHYARTEEPLAGICNHTPQSKKQTANKRTVSEKTGTKQHLARQPEKVVPLGGRVGRDLMLVLLADAFSSMPSFSFFSVQERRKHKQKAQALGGFIPDPCPKRKDRKGQEIYETRYERIRSLRSAKLNRKLRVPTTAFFACESRPSRCMVKRLKEPRKTRSKNHM